MSTFIGIGFSKNPNPSLAAQEAATQAKMQIQHSTIDLAIVFTTISHSRPEVLSAVRQTLNHPHVVGCSSAALICTETVEAQGISILAIKSDDIQFGLSSVNDIAAHHMRLAGADLARSAIASFGEHRRQIFLMIFDSLLQDASSLIKGAQDLLGTAFPIIGMGSSDNFRFEKTHQFFQDNCLTKSAVSLLFGGKARIGIGSGHGWKPLGKPRIIDESEGPVIKKIDGKKASSIYDEYFGKESKNLHSTKLARMAILYPLGLYVDGERSYLLRNAIEILPDGSIRCQGTVPEGSEIHLMIGNKDFCKNAAVQAAEQVKDVLSEKYPKAILIFESLARYKLLGRESIQEIQMIKSILGYNVPIMGMYSNGEIAPFKSLNHIGTSYLQNEAIIIVAIE